MNEITYPIILTYEDNMIYGGVPDLNIDNYATFGETVEEVLDNLKEIITLTLSDLEDNKNEFPKASEVKELKKILEDNQDILLLNMWLPYEKSKLKLEYKKKTLSIPTWLDILATQKNLNFSQILVKAIKKELNIKE
ncbi:type II toxin-antitoxin system HicB family antitoxin [Fusobacterium sp. HC1336]|uniref:type II toxin-antitoxin system HicB family antitoxin n=1 Tax=Fusobacterium sp. HC1336 TaxID=3171169 RepID=UPI003F234565